MTVRRTYNVVIEIETNNDARWLERELRSNFRDISYGKITNVEVLEDK